MTRTAPEAAVARTRDGERHVLLHITHHWGGGTEQHVQELCEYLGDGADHVVLHGTEEGWLHLDAAGHDRLRLHPERDFDALVSRLRQAAVTRVHVHQLFTIPVDTRRLIGALGVPFDFTVHDYHTVCPRVHFKTRDNAYCGEPDEAGCKACLVDYARQDERDIVAYRARYAWVYQQADRIICPTRDVAARVLRYHPRAPVVVAPHPRPDDAHPVPAAPPLGPDERLQVAILGWVTAFKGSARVLETARRIEQDRLPIALRVIGTIDGDPPPSLEVSGPYAAADLAPMLAARPPHLLWYAAQVPETYSYILTEGLEAGLPVMVPRIGAFPERVHGRPWSWIVDWDMSPDEAVRQLMAVRAQVAAGASPVPPRHEVPTAVVSDGAFYRRQYL